MLRIFLIHRGLFLVICEMADLLCNGHVRPFPAEFSFFLLYAQQHLFRVRVSSN